MSSFVNRLISDDFVWSAITNNVVGPRKRNSGGGFHMNCPMCTSRGEKADRRMRCGVKPDMGGVVIYDFNCNFKARWKPGELLSRNMQAFLQAIGVSSTEVSRLNHKAFTYRSIFEKSPEAMNLIPEVTRPSFQTTNLPVGARSFEEWATEPEPSQDFLEVASYLFSRGDVIADASTFYWTPEPGRHAMNRRVIIPLKFEDRIVGYTARAIDSDVRPRYQMESQANYLFNTSALTAPKRKFVVLVEGVLDALAIDGVGLLGAHLNPQQAAWIKSQGKQVILVPDRDAQGARMIDVALENNWSVAFPAIKASGGLWWEEDVKDCAEAVKRYGRAWTLLSVIESATANKLEINLKRKLYV
jgi:hypothetical protein